MSTNGSENGKAKQWFTQGFNSQEFEAERAKNSNRFWPPNRFWVKAGESKKFVFVDDSPLCLHEHNPKINGNWRNNLTCLNGIEEEVVCCQTLGSDYSRYHCGYYTIIDCSEWKNEKTGEIRQFEIKFLQAKNKTLKNLERITALAATGDRKS